MIMFQKGGWGHHVSPPFPPAIQLSIAKMISHHIGYVSGTHVSPEYTQYND